MTETPFDRARFIEQNAKPGELERIRAAAMPFAREVRAGEPLCAFLDRAHRCLYDALVALEGTEEIHETANPLAGPAIDVLLHGNADLTLWRRVMEQPYRDILRLVELARLDVPTGPSKPAESTC